MLIERGDGVGIELTRDVVRGVRLSHEMSSVAAAAEVTLHDPDDELFLLDAFVRVRGLLGNPTLPTRIAIFPSGSSMFRTDVTGCTGRELHAKRVEFEHRHGVTSTVLVDDGPQRWMHVLHWSAPDLRRLEDVAERAGFLDAAIEPSPLALARALATGTTFVERAATTGERYLVTIDNAMPIAAAAIESTGALHPRLTIATDAVAPESFAGLIEPFDLARRLVEIRRAQAARETDLRLNGIAYPRFPRDDTRAPDRQCVALGAAVGAAGLAGRLRPIDVVDVGPAPNAAPWAIDRVSTLPPLIVPAAPSATRRLTARLVPRRRG